MGWARTVLVSSVGAAAAVAAGCNSGHGHSDGASGVDGLGLPPGGAAVTLEPALPAMSLDGPPGAWTRRTVLPLPVVWPFKYQGDAMVFDEARAAVLKFGGYDSRSTMRNTAELWSYPVGSGVWTKIGDQQSPPPWPSARCKAPFAYDASRSVAVLLAGSGLCPVGDSMDDPMWEWNGSGWRSVADTAGARPGDATGMTYDRRNGRFVVVSEQEIWSYAPDSGQWSRLVENFPVLLTAPRIAADEARGTFLVWSQWGSDQVGEWDPTRNTYTPLMTAGNVPYGTIWDDIVYLASRGVFLTVGGSTNAVTTHEIDPATNTWTRRLRPSDAPGEQPRSGYLGNALVYDRARDTAILIEQGIFEYLEVWEWPAQ